ncbi:Multidrug resistance-associated protein 1 [Hypsibius exemplaris]|uniref:ABC-type glutathione-S-conjugate transporter n=1 Tax=Hypsibius exemplaris TaxID=2072580 RepID=A0A9X6NFN5_HYPEX|nr:Multidrug resistance-associated protein 1 [Hypsibius exemplaris]
MDLLRISLCLRAVTYAGLANSPTMPVDLPVYIKIFLSMWYVYVYRRRARPSSAILFVFWLAMLIAGIVRYRTLIERATIYGISDPLKFGTQMVYLPVKPCPEQLSSVPSRLTFWWFTSMVYLGFRKPLVQSDLWTLDEFDRTQTYSERLQRNWDYEVDRWRRSQPDISTPEGTRVRRTLYEPSLTKALIKTVWAAFIQTAGLRIIGDVAVFISPQVMRLLIDFVTDQNEQSWKGYFYVSLMFAGAFSQVLAMGHFFYMSQRCGMHVKSALISCVYQKALRLSNAAKRSSTVGEIVNLMAVDAQRFAELIHRVQILWSAPFQISLALYFLWQALGPSALAGLGVMILLIPINSVTIRYLRRLQVANMKNKDNRIKLMNEILSGMKILKLYAWEESFQGQVSATRELELATLFRAAYVNAFSGFISLLSPFMVAVTTFTTYVLSDPSNVLDAQKAFVSLSLFNILRQPVNNLPDVIAAIIQAQVSIARLTKFLKNDELSPESVQILSATDPSISSSVLVADASFSWGTEDSFTLKSINFEVPQKSLVAVVGQVGAGKSSLCSAVIGLMDKTRGTVVRKGTVAYVSQQAWIQNLTLKENILFGQPLVPELYEKVIDACALRPDIELLPAGDNTEIGEKGINLSGGQKQRVSLARAVYSNADLYILDDPLSAVDAHVGKHIFEQVIGSAGILKSKTRILVTHGIGYLPKVDKIVVLDEGTVAEVGTYKELLRNKGAFSKVLCAYLVDQEEAEESDDEDIIAVKEDIKKEIGALPPFDRSTSVTSQSSLRRVKRIVSRQESKPSPGKKPSLVLEKNGIELKGMKTGKLMEKEKSETGSVAWNTYAIYLRYLTRPVSVVVFLLYVCSNAASMGTNFWLGDWSQDSTFPERANDTDWRNRRIGVYGAIGVAQGIFILSSAFVLAYGQNLASRSLHRGMLTRIMRAPMSFFDQTPMGRIMNRFSKDIDVIDMNIPMNFRMWLNSMFNVFGTIIVICISTPIFATVIVPLGIIYYLMQRFFIPTSRQLKRMESVSRSPVFSHFQESLTGSSVIIATSSQKRFVIQNESLVDKNNTSAFAFMTAQRWLAVRVELIGNFVTLFAGLFAVIGRDQDWNISPGDTGLSITYALSVTQTLNWLIRISSDLEANIVSVERVKEYTEIAMEAPWVIEDHRPEVSWPEEGVVDFNRYETKYRPELEPVLRGITCHIKGGDKIGIVGRTGAGKSSLTLALFRLIEGTGGSIVLDNIDISTIGLHDLRSRLTIIPQDPVLFSGTLRLNLDPFAVYTDENVWHALENAHLKRFVSSLPNGLSHMVAEGGDNLSVGQRQLICLARALLRKTKLLILDEATAAVDLETDTLIQATIREKFADCTVLTIAHRLNTILDSTRVMVLDQGLIKEFDTPAQLLKDRTSLFYGLARSANLQVDDKETSSSNPS